MHGRLKVRTTAEQQEIKAKERAKKLAVYKAAMDRIFCKRKSGELDDEILKITGQVLTENPDISTLWNIRKETILKIKDTMPDLVDNYVSKELLLTEQCIRVNPKSYNSWFHRNWVLDKGSKVDFQAELALCDKCLELDERNFHCWDYRRIIVQMSKTPLESELQFSTEKITTNFSNYSSWHYRSELLPRIYPSSNSETLLDDQRLAEECNLIQNAIFTDPNDQSAWFYQRWLLFSKKEGSTTENSSFLSVLNNELESCQQLRDLEPNNKWVILQVCELLRRINSVENEKEILQLVSQLTKVDPLRRGYYAYFGSKIAEENQRKTIPES
ncbi:geranylgeranyl transferase type-2 subunit alpha-like [Daphnia carinata]|uniref:geranylgeranyl transferase type-2 subunit alpha-like n=1 Tax=Daphnia carinata TaxID=120202 RepID=UPI00257D644E|nr:geranylgeranyl transferase type-2 subunit alpha-like [Daphnia carinata]